jgi:hypothetical protein
MGDAQINEPRLFAPGDDFDRVPERFLCAFQKFGAVLCLAQRVGARGSHCALRQLANALAEALQAGQRATDRLPAQIAFVV